MKETELLVALIPSHPNLTPIIQNLRGKYNLPEISPDDEPISEIFSEDAVISLEEFRQEIVNLIRESLTFLPLNAIKIYKSSKSIYEIACIGHEL
ncbi:MAG: hypothetical protein A2X25_09745 [Chloroflexi bacterium GWB2_49_20]|nr:MAG: hypothetical protein A2X25_09745 [Chloroflexi bacterium GWB2_49_20]OGN79294.1 MAG: hypothetical protein A2X26_04280 [Chloroflexi bacterium GWC2_49_37]OGN82936.1 MAG: hypothetical protein A2X27_08415 [Chloroflexi bacterium GWD2_49_16]HCC78588.1 hypothetical protein [Anaerolineae bacterium]